MCCPNKATTPAPRLAFFQHYLRNKKLPIFQRAYWRMAGSLLVVFSTRPVPGPVEVALPALASPASLAALESAPLRCLRMVAYSTASCPRRRGGPPLRVPRPSHSLPRLLGAFKYERHCRPAGMAPLLQTPQKICLQKSCSRGFREQMACVPRAKQRSV